MELIERQCSVITGKANLESLDVLNNFPVFFGCVDTQPKEDLFADMNWCIDPDSGVIQISKLIPLEILYQSQHVDGYGATWDRYYSDFSDFIASYEPHNILEIGGGQGKIAEIVTSKLIEAHWTMAEPNPEHKGAERIAILKTFFDETFTYDKPLDTIVFSQVLEHAYDPQAFIKKIADTLPVGGRLIFAYPNLELWLKKKYTNALNFEHTMFITDVHLEYLLQKYGFDIKDKKIYGEHSFFYAVEKRQEKNELPELPNKYFEYKKIFNEFVCYYKDVVSDINKRIINHDGPIYLFGAHIFSQYLLSFGLNDKDIVTVLDNSKAKQGKRLYGTRYIVESPRILADIDRAAVILKAGIYNDEIKEDILNNINPNVVFWE